MSIRTEINPEYAKRRGYLFLDHIEKSPPSLIERWHPALPKEPQLDWEAPEWLVAPIEELIMASIRCSELVPYVLWCAIVRRREEFLQAAKPTSLPNCWFLIKIGDDITYSGTDWEGIRLKLWTAFETRWKAPENMEFDV